MIVIYQEHAFGVGQFFYERLSYAFNPKARKTGWFFG